MDYARSILGFFADHWNTSEIVPTLLWLVVYVWSVQNIPTAKICDQHPVHNSKYLGEKVTCGEGKKSPKVDNER